MPKFCWCVARPRARGDGTCATVGCPAFRLSARGANLIGEPIPCVRMLGKQPMKATPRNMVPHHTKSGAARVKVQTHSGARMPGATEPSTPSGDTVAQVRRDIRAKTLEDLLVGIVGEPTYLRILAVALSWLGQCSCVPTMDVNVCVAASVLTGITFEAAAPYGSAFPSRTWQTTSRFAVQRSSKAWPPCATTTNRNTK